MLIATVLRNLTGEEVLDVSPRGFVLPEGKELEDIIFHQGENILVNTSCDGSLDGFTSDLSARYYLPPASVRLEGYGVVTVTFLRDVLEKEVSSAPDHPQRVVFEKGKTYEVDRDGSAWEDPEHSDYWWPPDGSYTVAYTVYD